MENKDFKINNEDDLQQFANDCFEILNYNFKNIKVGGVILQKGIEKINQMATKGNVYIITASPNLSTDLDKLKWVQKYLPDLPHNNIVICRIGENKAFAIKRKLNIQIDNTCYLLDDYTKNLKEWEEVGGIGIKRITAVSDNSTKKWQGLELKDLCKLDLII